LKACGGSISPCLPSSFDAHLRGNGRDALADLLRWLDDDSLRAADVAEPVAVLVALHHGSRARRTPADTVADVRPVVFDSGRPFFAAGGLAEPLRLENPTRIVPGDRVTHLVYDVCTG
jgi:hypothetical protein